MFTIYGLGGETVLYGLLACLAGLPLYAIFKTRG
jgi:hypothetical protein